MSERRPVGHRLPALLEAARRRPMVASLLAFVAGAILMLPSLRLPAGRYDEAAIAMGGETILRGGLPYRDFWTIYPPGVHYVAAGLFAAFGSSLTPTRIAEIVLRSLLAVLIARIALRLAGGTAAVLSGVVACLMLANLPPGLQPLTLAFALVLAATELLLGALDRPAAVPAAVAGALIALAVTVRHDLAAYGAAAHAAGLALGFRAGGRAIRAPALAYLAALTIGILLVLGMAWATLPMRDLFEDVIVVPATVYPVFRRLARTGVTYLSPALAVGLLVLALRLPVHRVTGVTVGVLGVLMWNVARIRPDLVHLTMAWLPLTALGVVVLSPLPARARRLVGGACLAVILAVATERALPVIPTPAEGCARHSDNPGVVRRLGVACAPAEELAMADRLATGEGPIFVAGGRHDRLVANDILLYWLAGRPSATRYYDFHPGVTTTERVQQEIVRDLARIDTVIVSPVQDVIEPNASAVSSGVVLLDHAITEQFRPVGQVGWYRVLARSGP